MAGFSLPVPGSDAREAMGDLAHVADASTYALFVRIPGGVAVLRHRSGRYYQKPVYARWDDDTKNVRLYAMFRGGYLALGGNNYTSDQTVTWRTLVLPEGDRVRETDRLGRPVWAARG